MNKKVLTLCAGLLLAGGAFSFVNASEWPSDTDYVLNTGKYHLLHQVAVYNGSWSPATGAYLDYYLSADENGTPIASKSKDTNAYWTITSKDVAGVTYYQFKNAEGNTLVYTHNAGTPTEQKIDWFIVESATSPVTFNDLAFMDGTTKYYLNVGSTPISGTTDYPVVANIVSAGVRGFDNEEITEEVIPAADLNAVLKDGFGLLFGPGKDKEYKNLSGAEAFSGKIEAVPVSGATGKYYFKRADGKYIVLSDDFIGEPNSTLDGTDDAIYRGYNFKAVSKHAFDTEINKNNAVFTVYKSYDFNDTDSLIVTLPYAGITSDPDEQLGHLPIAGLNQGDDCPGLRVFVASSRNDDFLTTIEYKKANDRLAIQEHNDKTIAQFGALAPYIQFGMTNIVDFEKFAGKVWNITDVKGNVLAPDVNWVDADYFSKAFGPAAQVQLNKPEGQWLPYYTDADNYGFVNRESGVKWNLKDGWVIRSTDTKDLYEIYNSKYLTSSNDAEEKVYIKEAEDAELGWTENGYANYKAATEALNGKYLTLTNGVTGETTYVGKDADDNVILTNDRSEAIEFRVKDLLHNYTSHDGLQGVDTLQHITTYMGFDEDGEITYNAKDTLQFYHYRLFEHFSEKYLTYDASNQKYILVGAVTDDNEHEDFRKYKWRDNDGEDADLSTFVLKEKADGTYNLISRYQVEYDYCEVIGDEHTEMNPNAEYDNDMNANLYMIDDEYRRMSEKMYGAFQTATLSNMAYIYNYNDNDRFDVVDIATPEYMTITDAQDTVKISLQNFQNFYMYEQGVNGTNFLGMNHTADVDDMKAAIFVDTAYVRNNTYRPQYLLAVNAKHTEPEWDSNPSHTIPHLLHPDSTTGRFLVSMVDSAVTYKGSVNTNPYIRDNMSYFRLAFIDGVHTGDKLYLNTANGKTTIDLSNNNDKVCTFAFRYVDEDREGVKIETRYNSTADNTIQRGWLKYQNNVPVVTDNYNDAHVFLVDNTTTEAPTANETINAEGAVSVVATDGAVIIKGAEGKNVVIATILGKVVANETINSDNETIAVPAGIAVVSVDGESFKVVVK